MKKSNEKELAKPAAGTCDNVKKHDLPSSIAMLFGWNMEMAQFYFRRYQQYCTSPISFAACKTLDDVQHQQAEFLNCLMADYRENATRLSMIAHIDQPVKSADAAYSEKLLQAQEDAAAIIEQAKAQADRILRSAQAVLDRSDAKPQEQVVTEEPQKKRA